MQIIDPHVHFFHLQQGDYHWLKADNPPNWQDKKHIYQPAYEKDISLQPPLTLAGWVHIEAGYDNQRPWREVDWLQSHATLPFRTVAGADLTQQNYPEKLQKLLARPSVAGVRQSRTLPAEKLLKNPTVIVNLALLAKHGLSVDIQLDFSDSPSVEALIAVIEHYPQLRVIVNHAGVNHKQIKASTKHNLKRFQHANNLAIKLSGWEMHNRHWQFEQITPWIEHCLACVGSTRLMLASNFPLCLWRLPYQPLWQTYVDHYAKDYPECFAENARHWYRLVI
jgi:predicted TIM-barrel fold metal-dependent hydrolase